MPSLDFLDKYGSGGRSKRSDRDELGTTQESFDRDDLDETKFKPEIQANIRPKAVLADRGSLDAFMEGGPRVMGRTKSFDSFLEKKSV